MATPSNDDDGPRRPEEEEEEEEEERRRGERSSSSSRTTVAVIGCGPSGMFFLHALETRRRNLVEIDDVRGLENLPIVSVFERSDGPGGVWRSSSSLSSSSSSRTNATAIGCSPPPATAPSSEKEDVDATADDSVPSVEESDDGGSSTISDEGRAAGASAIDDDDRRSDEIAVGEEEEEEESEEECDDSSDDDSSDEEREEEEEEEEEFAPTSASSSPSPATNMYEALWTNGPKECIEFFDYTYAEHFGRSLPVYLPRSMLLEYMIARVTRLCPTILEDHVTFGTSVDGVTYDEGRKKFVVRTTTTTATASDGKGPSTTKEEVGYYDKCIWAAGDNGRPHFPKTASLLRRKGYRGRILHSSSANDLESAVRDKVVIMVGDSYSSEDLALTSLTLGVRKVYILSRGGEGMASYVAAWPGGRVEVLKGYAISGVVVASSSSNGDDKNGLRISEVEYDTETEDYEFVEDDDDRKAKHKTLHDVDTVIFCTGYAPDLSMLDESLTKPIRRGKNETVRMPTDWTMTHNALSDDLGDVTPGRVYPNEGSTSPGLHRGVLMSNPSMMFFRCKTDTPLLELDVKSWLFLSYVAGDASVPDSIDEMKRSNYLQTLEDMEAPSTRYNMDDAYWSKWNGLPEDHWSTDMSDGRTRDLERSQASAALGVLARDARTGGYPLNLLSPPSSGAAAATTLNEIGTKLAEMDVSSAYHRYDLDPNDPKTNEWKTFRDCDDPERFESVHTPGAVATTLKGRWLDLMTNANAAASGGEDGDDDDGGGVDRLRDVV